MSKVLKRYSEKLNVLLIAFVIGVIFISLFYTISYYSAQKAYTHNVVLESNRIDYNAVWEEFEEKEVVESDEAIDVKVVDYLDEDPFVVEVQEGVEEVQPKVEYELHHDRNIGAFYLNTKITDRYGNVTEEMLLGAPFVNEEGINDVLFEDADGDTMLLSEIDKGELDNCGFFKKLGKGFATVAVVALVAVAVVAVVAVGCTALVPVTGGTSCAASIAAAGEAMAAVGLVASTAALVSITLDEFVRISRDMGVSIGSKDKDKFSGIKKLNERRILTSATIQAIMEELKKQDIKKYLLLGAVSSKEELYTEFEPATYEQAVTWMKNGGNVYTLVSFDAIRVVEGAGYLPRDSKGFFLSESHNINGVPGFEHYHAWRTDPYSKVNGIHSFFGTPFTI